MGRSIYFTDRELQQLRNYALEAIEILGEGVETAEQTDDDLKDGLGSAMRKLYKGYNGEALTALENFGMITRDGNMLAIPGWEEHQNIEGKDKIREQNRIRKQKQRERQKFAIEQDMSRDSSRDVTQQNKIKNKKEELDKDKEKDNNLIVSKDTIRQTDVRRVAEEWNKLQDVGITPIRDIKPASKRCQMLKGRIREYGMDDILKAMGNIRHSDFLRGDNKNGWMITFDWFVKPNNFLKVLEGNYNGDRKHGSGAKTQRKVEPLIPFGTLSDDGDSDTLPFM